MALSPPLISVIMSVSRSRPDFLHKAIQSIVNQTLKNWEFIIVIDGPDSEPENIIKNYQRQDRRIMVLNNTKNLGLTISLNRAMARARGTYIARMDDDDISFPDRLATQLAFLTKHSYDLISSAYWPINDTGVVLTKKIYVPPLPLQAALMKGNFFTHSTWFGKRNVFKQQYNESFRLSQDYELLLRLVSKHYRIGYQAVPVLYYRRQSKSISVTQARLQEWFALRARWQALWRYQYGWYYFPLFLRASLSFLVPVSLKRSILQHV